LDFLRTLSDARPESVGLRIDIESMDALNPGTTQAGCNAGPCLPEADESEAARRHTFLLIRG
jgi:hypothetical protein